MAIKFLNTVQVDTDVLYVDTANDRVGIGTTSPAYKLHVNGGDAQIANGNTATLYMNNSANYLYGDVNGVGIVAASNNFRVKTNNSERLRIIQNGNVGIGTTSPQQKLDVVGRVRASYNTSNYYEIGASSAGGFVVGKSGGVETVNIRTYGDSHFNGGNVGIGTTSPGTKLEITGSTATAGDTTLNLKLPVGNITAGVTEMGNILFSSSDASGGGTGAVAKISTIAGDGTNAWVGSGRPADLAFFTQPLGASASLVEAMRIDQDGNVGIGTTIPDAPLHVLNDSSVNVLAKIRIQGDSTSGYGDIGMQSGYIRLFSNGSMCSAWTGGVQYNYINGSTATTLTSTGLGIGTTSPSAKLHVNSSDATVVQRIQGATNSALEFYNSSTKTGAILVNSTQFLIAADNSNYLNINTGGSERMRITAAGNVGIGTTSPNGRLNIQSSAASTYLLNLDYADGTDGGGFYEAVSTDLSLYLKNSSGTNNVTIASDGDSFFNGGNVGIGTTSPGYKLEVNSGSTNNVAKFESTDSTARIVLKDNAGEAHLNAIGDDMVFATSSSGSERMRIDSAGNVGIGTTSPSSRLTVSGTNNATSEITLINTNPSTDNDWSITPFYNDQTLRFRTNSAATTVMTLKDNGNVGIGTTSPQSKLHLATTGGSTLTIQNTTNSGNAALNFRDEGNNDQFKIYYALGANRSYNLVNGNGLTVYSSQASVEIARFGNASSGYTDSYFTGNVGIGTTSPSVNLDIEDSSNVIVDMNTTTANANTTIRLQESGTVKATIGYDGTNNGLILTTGGFTAGNGIFIDDSQNVGIGTDSPTHLLTLETASSPGLKIKDTTQGATLLAFSQDSDSHIGTYSSHPLVLDTNSTERMRITSTGNVGIGTTGPVDLLHIKSTTTDARMVIDGADGFDAELKFFEDGSVKYTTGFDAATDSYVIGTVNVDTNKRLVINNSGALQLPTYTAGTLVSDASGNITVSSGGGAGGPYLPLAGGTMTGSIKNGDSVYSYWGTGDDLQIGHDGSNSYIIDRGVGDLLLYYSDDFVVSKYGTSEISIRANQDSSVELFFDNTKKFETTSSGVTVTGDIVIDSALLSNQENTDIDTGAETVAEVSMADYTAAFFDFVIKKGTNVRSGTVYACHDGSSGPVIEFTETSTQDLGDTSDVVLSVDKTGSGGGSKMRLLATVASDDWSVKSLVRAI